MQVLAVRSRSVCPGIGGAPTVPALVVLRIRDSVYSGRLRAIISKKAAFYVQIVNSERTFEGLAWAFGNPWLSQSCFQEFSSRTK